jgi:hypothetical protein
MGFSALVLTLDDLSLHCFLLHAGSVYVTTVWSLFISTLWVLCVYGLRSFFMSYGHEGLF